jgi:uncharacterized protein (TIGR03067 family)
MTRTRPSSRSSVSLTSTPRRAGVVLLALGCIVAGAGALTTDDDPKREAIRKELKRMEGTWRIARLELGGQKLIADQDLGRWRIVIDAEGRGKALLDGKVTDQAVSKIDPTVRPKITDITYTEGPAKGRTVPGIYELDDDTYTICFDMGGMTRPKEFASKPGTMLVLEVLKREQAAPKPR